VCGWVFRVCACVCVCLRLRVRARVCVHVRVRAGLRVRVQVHVCVRLRVHVRVHVRECALIGGGLLLSHSLVRTLRKHRSAQWYTHARKHTYNTHFGSQLPRIALSRRSQMPQASLSIHSSCNHSARRPALQLFRYVAVREGESVTCSDRASECNTLDVRASVPGREMRQCAQREGLDAGENTRCRMIQELKSNASSHPRLLRLSSVPSPPSSTHLSLLPPPSPSTFCRAFN